ncbi:MAG TPA: hypothetical protein VK849_08860, partial [Longimicrobiales bacterium]|nr:hypothetical protein [Longimicrobiales bacterium]
MSRIARHGLLALALLVVGCSERSERSPPAAADSLAAVEGAGTEEAPSPDTGGPTVAREPAQAAVDTTGSTGVESATTGTALPEPDTTTAQVPPADPAAAQTRTGIQSEDLRAVLARLDQIALAQAALAARLDSLREARATGEESGTAPSQVLGQARD